MTDQQKHDMLENRLRVLGIGMIAGSAAMAAVLVWLRYG